ncbi:MAG: hypothetical protein R2748_28220 [Bryobacterales bacterium]
MPPATKPERKLAPLTKPGTCSCGVPPPGQAESTLKPGGRARVTGPRVGPAVKVVEACPWASVTAGLAEQSGAADGEGDLNALPAVRRT